VPTTDFTDILKCAIRFYDTPKIYLQDKIKIYWN